MSAHWLKQLLLSVLNHGQVILVEVDDTLQDLHANHRRATPSWSRCPSWCHRYLVECHSPSTIERCPVAPRIARLNEFAVAQRLADEE